MALAKPPQTKPNKAGVCVLGGPLGQPKSIVSQSGDQKPEIKVSAGPAPSQGSRGGSLPVSAGVPWLAAPWLSLLSDHRGPPCGLLDLPLPPSAEARCIQRPGAPQTAPLELTDARALSPSNQRPLLPPEKGPGDPFPHPADLRLA